MTKPKDFWKNHAIKNNFRKIGGHVERIPSKFCHPPIFGTNFWDKDSTFSIEQSNQIGIFMVNGRFGCCLVTMKNSISSVESQPFSRRQNKAIYTPVIQHSWLENGPFEDVFAIKNGDIPLLCLITGVYHNSQTWTKIHFDTLKSQIAMIFMISDCCFHPHLNRNVWHVHPLLVFETGVFFSSSRWLVNLWMVKHNIFQSSPQFT